MFFKIKFKKSSLFSKKIIFSYLMLLLFILIIFIILYFYFSLSTSYLFYFLFIFSVIYFSIFYFINRIKKQDEKIKISKELPFFLNSLASDLDKNIPLKLSLENQSKKNTIIGNKIKKALFLVLNKNFTLESSLETVVKGNIDLERVIYQINDILQSGTKNKAETFRLLSNNFVEQQSMEIKNYSTKLNFLSLIFVVVSAIVPAMFLMFFLVGSNFFEISISSFGIIVITLLIFPIIDMFILLVMRSNMVWFFLKIKHLIAIDCILVVVLVLFKINIFLILFFIIIFSILLLVLEKAIINYFRSIIKKKLENALLDEVLILSSQPRVNDLKQIVYKLSVSTNIIVSREFKLLKYKIETGHSIKETFLVLAKKYNSEILDRFLELLYNSVTTGTVSSSDYRLFANNFLKTKQLMNERQSVLLIQKYTIIFAGGFIVPGILGLVISLVKKMMLNLDLSILGTITSDTGIFIVCYYCSLLYIIEYVIISSIYLGMLETNLKKSIIYFLFLAPVAIVLFFVGQFFF